MLLRDLSDAFAWIRRLIYRVDRLEGGAMLENSSISHGRMRFIGGLLLIDSGGRLTVVGHVNGEGDLVWDGPWALKGLGEITGDVSITGDLELLDDGSLKVGDIVIGDGKITTGNVRIEDGKIYAGGMTIDPATDGGTVTFSGGRRVSANDGAIGLLNGPNAVTVTSDGVSILGKLWVPFSAVQFSGLPTGTVDDVTHWIGADAAGNLIRVSKASGGPTGSGEFAWPFALSLVTKEYGPDPIYDDGMHKGIDFGAAPGAPIPAASGGTVLAVGFDSERGNYVILSHGDRGAGQITTRYYHLISPSPLSEGASVAKGVTVGFVGSTGFSTGAHLHFETRVGGEHMNPRSFMAIYGE